MEGGWPEGWWCGVYAEECLWHSSWSWVDELWLVDARRAAPARLSALRTGTKKAGGGKPGLGRVPDSPTPKVRPGVSAPSQTTSQTNTASTSAPTTQPEEGQA